MLFPRLHRPKAAQATKLPMIATIRNPYLLANALTNGPTTRIIELRTFINNDNEILFLLQQQNLLINFAYIDTVQVCCFKLNICSSFDVTNFG